MELVKKFSPEQFTQALRTWRWLVPQSAVPLLASSFGDIFFAYDKMIYFLDLVNGSFDSIACSLADLENLLQSPSGQEDYLMATLSITLQESGKTLAPHEIFDFKQAPKLGGNLSPKNIQVMDFVTALQILGQIHQQIKDLPPGTEITGVSFTDS